MEEKESYPPYILELESKISMFFKTIKERHVHDASETSISMPQFFCMWILSKCGKQKMSELATNLALSYASATNLINRLSDSGFVNRYDDPDDRRVVMVELSEKGTEITDSIRKKYVDQMRDKCNLLNKEQIDTLLKGMDILINIISLEKNDNLN